MSTLLPILLPSNLLEDEAFTPEAQSAEEEKSARRRYFQKQEEALLPAANHEPVCLYLETANCCNLLCVTCPRTYEQLEPEADMPWEMFTSLIDQYPNIDSGGANVSSLARAESALFEHTTESEEALIREAEAVAAELGVMFSASGEVDPGESIRMARTDKPWSLCRRPWSLMYITANGRELPCCIVPFSMKAYGSFTLGDATQDTLRDIWNGAEYQQFREGLLSSAPPPAYTNCGLGWSLEP